MQALPLLERDEHLLAIREALSAARESSGRLLIIDGRPGVGKSRLATEAIEIARGEGIVTLSARGDEAEREFAYGVVLQLFERIVRPELLTGAAALAAPLFDRPSEAVAAASDTSALLPILHGLYWLTANLAEEAPLLIAIDDAHWADEPSLRFVQYLSQRIDELPAVTVLMTRPAEAGETLTALRGHPQAARQSLEPLTFAGVETVLRDALGAAVDETFCRVCNEVTGGNPFLLSELVRELHEREIEPTQAAAEQVRALQPETLTPRIVARLGRLGAEATALARTLAVLRESTPLHQAARVAGLETATADEAAIALAGADIVVAGARLSFAHPLVREAVYSGTDPARRAELHRCAARVLHEDGEPPERVAGHLLEARPAGDAGAVATLRLAATRASLRGAPASAAKYLRRALAEPPSASERAAVTQELAQAAASAGERDAGEAFTAALELAATPDQRARLLLGMARDQFAGGRTRDAVETLDRGLAELNGHDAELAIQLRSEFMPLALLDPSMIGRAAQEGAVLLERIGTDEPTPAGRAALAALTLHSAFAGTPREDLMALARRALGDGKLLEEQTSEGTAVYSVTIVLNASDELELQEQVLTDAIDDARRRGSVMAFATASYCRSAPRYLMGKLDEAIADAEAAIGARRYGWEQYLAVTYAYLALMQIDRDDMPAARAALDRADDPRLRGMISSVPVLEALGRYELEAGNPAAALGYFTAWGQIGQWPNPGMQNAWRSNAALAHVALGNREEAVRLAGEELELARTLSGARSVGVALRALGLAQGGDEGIESLRSAVEVLGGSPARPDRARALLDLGAALRRAGRRSEAREPLESALALAEPMNARRIAARARAELENAGVSPRRASREGAGVLTPSELRIARMAADGMKNREIAQALFVTVKAVEFHLGNAYRKLEVSGRRDLPEALR
jgi:DNA-binding CsgD family transcriptional regulator